MRIPFAAGLFDKVRSSLWFIPALMVLGGAVLSFVIVAADRRLIDSPGRSLLLYGGGADGARAVLGTVASSMMTVAGVVFSITIVALTLASQQFGPRVLRNFMEDRGNQVVLGTFIATFIYCLLVARTVIGGDDDAAFVPHLAVTGAVLLSILSLGVLIYFIHHVSSSIRAETIIARVAEELTQTIDRLYPDQIGDEEPKEEVWQIAGPYEMRTEIVAESEGYLQTVDDTAVMETASRHDLLLRFRVIPGDFIEREQLLMEVHSRGTVEESARERLQSAFVIGSARTPVQDVEFPLHQLVQIAARALSPGVNDPFTAMNAIDRIGAGLRTLGARRFPSPVRRDEQAIDRVYAPRKSFEEITVATLDPLQESAERSPVVQSYLETVLTRDGELAGAPPLSTSRGGST